MIGSHTFCSMRFPIFGALRGVAPCRIAQCLTLATTPNVQETGGQFWRLTWTGYFVPWLMAGFQYSMPTAIFCHNAAYENVFSFSRAFSSRGGRGHPKRISDQEGTLFDTQIERGGPQCWAIVRFQKPITRARWRCSAP